MANVKKETVKETEVAKETATATPKKATTKKVVEETIIEEVKTTSTVNAVNTDYERLERENAELKAKMNLILERLALQSVPQQIQVSQPQEKKYKLVNLTSDHNTVELRFNWGTITLKGYCDWVEITEEKFRDVVREYHGLFRRGFLTTDSEGAKIILEQRKIKIANKWLTRNQLDNLDELRKDELIELYNSLHETQREVLVNSFIDGVNYGEKEGFKDINKLVALNSNYKGISFKSQLENTISKVSKTSK